MCLPLCNKTCKCLHMLPGLDLKSQNPWLSILLTVTFLYMYICLLFYSKHRLSSQLNLCQPVLTKFLYLELTYFWNFSDSCCVCHQQLLHSVCFRTKLCLQELRIPLHAMRAYRAKQTLICAKTYSNLRSPLHLDKVTLNIKISCW